MGHTFHAELESLKKQLLGLSALAEEAFRGAVRALDDGDRDTARAVIDADPRIDRAEVDLEEECLKVLALHQPVATDLRFLITVLRLTGDLERIGDVAVKIARRTLDLLELGGPPVALNLGAMADRTADMLARSLDALVGVDASKAREVRVADDEVDAMKRERVAQIKEIMVREPDRMETCLHLMSVVRHLERVADYATNIAEEVVYLAEGLIVRHQQVPSAGA